VKVGNVTKKDLRRGTGSTLPEQPRAVIGWSCVFSLYYRTVFAAPVHSLLYDDFG